MSSNPATANARLYFTLKNDDSPASHIPIGDGEKVAHTRETTNDVLVILKKVDDFTYPVRKSHFSCQFLAPSAPADVSANSAQAPVISPYTLVATVGVVSLNDNQLSRGFVYSDLFGEHLFGPDKSHSAAVFRAAESSGVYWNGPELQVGHSDLVRFFYGDIVTLISTEAGAGHQQFLSLALATNGATRHLFSTATLPLDSSTRVATHHIFFFIQFSGAIVEVIGDITVANRLMPPPTRRLSLLAHSIQQKLIPRLTTSPCGHMVTTAPIMVTATPMVPPGLGLLPVSASISQLRSVSEKGFSAIPLDTPDSTPQLVNTSLSNLNLMSASNNTLKFTKVCGIGQTIDNKALLATDFTVYGELGLGQFQEISANQQKSGFYVFSQQASGSSVFSKLDSASHFSLAIFSAPNLSSPAQPLVINMGARDANKVSVKMICIHNKVLQMMPTSVLLPIIMTNKDSASRVVTLSSSGLYNCTVVGDGVEVTSQINDSVAKVDRLMLTSVKSSAAFFDEETFRTVVAAEERYASMRVHGNRIMDVSVNGTNGTTTCTTATGDSLNTEDMDFSIYSYTLCIALTNSCINILSSSDNPYRDEIKAKASTQRAQIKSIFSVEDFKPIDIWRNAIKEHASIRNTRNFRLLRNCLGFIGFISLSYKVATIDSPGMTMTTHIPHQASIHRVGPANPTTVCGISMPSGCNLQLVAYSPKKDCLNTNKNIAMTYYPSLNRESSRARVSSQTLLQREIFSSQFIIAYEFIYSKLCREAAQRKEQKIEKIEELLGQLPSNQDGGSTDIQGSVAAISSLLEDHDYMYNMFVSRELDRVQSPVRCSILRHVCNRLYDETQEALKRLGEKQGPESQEHKDAENIHHTWAELRNIAEGGVPFWLFFNSIIKGKRASNAPTSPDTCWTNDSTVTAGSEFLIAVHDVCGRSIYVLYVNGFPDQVLLTEKPLHLMLTFDAPWSFAHIKSCASKAPEYFAHYLQVLYGEECFQKRLPFTPYLAPYMSMIPLTSSVNLEMGTPSKSSNNADYLELYNNAANKMTHWESLSFVGTNSLVTPQTTNLYLSLFPGSGDAEKPLLQEAATKQYDFKGSKTKYDETSYVHLVGSQYRQEVTNYVGIHKFNNVQCKVAEEGADMEEDHLRTAADALSLNDTFLERVETMTAEQLLTPPPRSYIIDDISASYKGRDEKLKILNSLVDMYYDESYVHHNGKQVVLATDKSLGGLKDQVCELPSYKVTIDDLKQCLGVLYDDPIILYLVIGHCIDFTHMFNTVELVTRKNDLDTVAFNFLLLLCGGSLEHKPNVWLINNIVDHINASIVTIGDVQSIECFTTGNAGYTKRESYPESLFDVYFPPNQLQEEYRSFYNYTKLRYMYANRVFETRYNEMYHAPQNGSKAATHTSVSITPICSPPPSLYVRFERVYVPPCGVSLTESNSYFEQERANRGIDEFESVYTKVAKQAPPSFPTFEELHFEHCKGVYAVTDRKEHPTVVVSTGADKGADNYGKGQKDSCVITNSGYTADATAAKMCILLSGMLPTRPLYSHCLKVTVQFRGKYGRFLLDRYSSTFSCARFATEERGRKKYLELSGHAQITIILDYLQMFIFIYLHNLASDTLVHDQRVPWKINWPVRFILLLEHASAQITTAEV